MLSSNQDLYDYLLGLSSKLRARGSEELSKVVITASGHAASWVTTTEFLGESRIALRQVLKDERGILTVEERDKLLEVITEIDDVFNRRK